MALYWSIYGTLKFTHISTPSQSALFQPKCLFNFPKPETNNNISNFQSLSQIHSILHTSTSLQSTLSFSASLMKLSHLCEIFSVPWQIKPSRRLSHLCEPYETLSFMHNFSGLFNRIKSRVDCKRFFHFPKI
jgi:hypothetical protein